MLVVNVSKNVEDYQENVLGNLDAKKTLDILAGTAVSALVCILLHAGFGLGLTVSFYISSPVLFLSVLKALYLKDGMDFKTVLKLKHYETYKGPCIFQSHGNDSRYYMQLEQDWLQLQEAEAEPEDAEEETDALQGQHMGTGEAAVRRMQRCLAAAALLSLAVTLLVVLYLTG